MLEGDVTRSLALRNQSSVGSMLTSLLWIVYAVQQDVKQTALVVCLTRLGIYLRIRGSQKEWAEPLSNWKTWLPGPGIFNFLAERAWQVP